jgi:hypothetical protein
MQAIADKPVAKPAPFTQSSSPLDAVLLAEERPRSLPRFVGRVRRNAAEQGYAVALLKAAEQGEVNAQ